MRLKWFPAALVLLITIPLIFWACESEDLAEPNPNIYPETFISEISPGVTTLMAWYGTDVDGRVERFEYKWDDGEWVETTTLSETFPVGDVTNPYADFEFANVDEERTFYVRAIDNNEGTDPSPAMATMSPNTIRPETQILEGPEFGKTYGPDLYFKWSGVDKDGSVVGFEYTMDNLHAWTYVDIVDEGGSPVGEKTFLDLGPGAHIFYVRSVDELGTVDQTPAQVAFNVATGYIPQLSSTSPIVDGGGWFADVDVSFSWEINVDYYNGQLPHGYATFALDDSTGFADDAANMQYGWRPGTSLDIDGGDLVAGNHKFYLKVRDTQGTVAKLSIGFSAAAYNPTKKVLVVNGIAPLYGAEIEAMFTDSVYWGGFNMADVYFWDLFGSSSSPGVATIPTANYLGGGAAVTPDILADFECVIWAGNSYSGDLAYWNLTPIYPFLLAGGNVLLSARYSSDFFTPGLLSYAGISWREYSVELVDYQPMFPGLTACAPAGASYTDAFSSFGFNSGGGCTDDDVTGYDASRSFTNGAGTSTLLFAHRSSAVIGGFGYVRGIGVWAHPNLDYTSDLTQVTLPTPGTDEVKGNFVFLSGRSYRLGNAELKSNLRYIITNLFGVQ